jgi:hypothetical protein
LHETWGAESLQVAEVLNGRAELYKALNDSGHGEPLLLHAVEIRETRGKEADLEIAKAQNDLGGFYTSTGSYDKAA